MFNLLGINNDLKLVLRGKSESLWGIKIKTSGFVAGESFNVLI